VSPRSTMSACELVERRIAELRAKDFPLLIPAYEVLARMLGETKVAADGAAFLQWMLNWDSTTISGLAALVSAVRVDERSAL
jgi:hypothetical protein